jgi:hypothetical protein
MNAEKLQSDDRGILNAAPRAIKGKPRMTGRCLIARRLLR